MIGPALTSSSEPTDRARPSSRSGPARALPVVLCLAGGAVAALFWRDGYGLFIAAAVVSLVAVVAMSRSARAGSVGATVAAVLSLLAIPLLVIELGAPNALLPERIAEALACALLLAAAARILHSQALLAERRERPRGSRLCVLILALGGAWAALAWLLFSYAFYIAGEGGISDASRRLLGLCLLGVVLAAASSWATYRWPSLGALCGLAAATVGFVGIEQDLSANRLLLTLIWTPAATLLLAGSVVAARDALRNRAHGREDARLDGRGP